MTVADTTPYPWPWDGRVDIAHLALVVTGWDPYWLGATASPTHVLSRIRHLADACRHRFLLSHDVPRRARPSADAPPPDDVPGEVILVPGIDGFYASHLESRLRSLACRQILLAGFGLETTVHSTLRRANDMGFECLVVLDACAPVDPDLTPNAVSSIELSGGIFGAVGTTDAVLHTLAATTTAPDHKDHS